MSSYIHSALPDSELGATEINTLALNIIRDSAAGAGDSMIDISLASLLLGVLTVLSPTAIVFLTRRGSLTHTNSRVLILTTIILYMSTVTSQAHYLVLGATNSGLSPSYDGHQEIAAFEDTVRKQSWMAAIALELNCVIGDAIVWWHACIIWRNKAVYCIGPLLVILTLSVALLDTDNVFVKATVIVTLATNALSTILIAYKVWEHWQLVKKQFSSTGTKSRVLNVLALLVESGSIYCALVILVLFYQMDPIPSRASSGLVFSRVGTCFIYRCLPPLIVLCTTPSCGDLCVLRSVLQAIYPTVIIV
ncbi:hypothetical protein V8D89_009827, partial [Ganoderma adspersum]